PSGNDWIASIAESVQNRLNRVPSAKMMPLNIADQLMGAAAGLEKTLMPDLQLLARQARYQAHRQSAAYFLELFHQTKDSSALDRFDQEMKDAGKSFPGMDQRPADELIAVLRPTAQAAPAREIPALPKTIARPQFTETPVRTAPSDQPLNITLQLPPGKDAQTVRLHYRPIDRPGPSGVIEKAAASSVTFTIAPPDLPPSDLIYFFEILNRENSGWFEPDPAATTPYHVVRIEIK
ncbi:MAG TPA: hypothetical protein VKR43_11100, partial [Bryobacteraceae bacterium]|nr:hypothetical protein [Bryobacteraceae bacterium]